MAISIRKNNLIYPYFVVSGKEKKEKINSFPGQFRFSVDCLLKDINELDSLGIDKVLLFGIADKKDEKASSAYAEDNIVGFAVREIKKQFPHITVFADVCLCAYTSDGDCHLKSHANTLKALSRMALRHAEAGADYVAPSAIARGQVKAIRKALDDAGYQKTRIMGYSAKFASNFYGPFRNAAKSAPKSGDRSKYQLDYNDAKSALKKIREDVKEGADIVMVKPALSYLDIIRDAKRKIRAPLAAYSVSGEYVMLKYGAARGLWDEKKAVFEITSAIKRAGADYIITYYAKDIARWLRE
ncbi:MAG: porphobilinogen synthase [Candidatus Omnitrophota bacterium]